MQAIYIHPIRLILIGCLLYSHWYCMDKKCPNFGCLWGVLKVSGRCLEGVWKVLEGVWKVEGVWRMYGRCMECVMEDVWKVSRRCLKGASGRRLEGFYKVSGDRPSQERTEQVRSGQVRTGQGQEG